MPVRYLPSDGLAAALRRRQAQPLTSVFVLLDTEGNLLMSVAEAAAIGQVTGDLRSHEGPISVGRVEELMADARLVHLGCRARQGPDDWEASAFSLGERRRLTVKDL